MANRALIVSADPSTDGYESFVSMTLSSAKVFDADGNLVLDIVSKQDDNGAEVLYDQVGKRFLKPMESH